MKRMISNKNRSVFKLGFVTAVTAACGTVGTASATVNTVSRFTSGTALDTPSNWTPTGVPTISNDALMAPGYPTATLNTTLSSNQSFGSLDVTNTASLFNIYGPSGTYLNSSGGTVAYNASIYTLTLGGGGGTNGILNNSNGVAGANANDLIYAATGTEIDIRTGGTTTVYGLVALNIATSGNFDAAGTGVIYDNNRVLGTGQIIKTGTGTLYLESVNSTLTGGLNISNGEVSILSGAGLGTAPGANAQPQLVFSGNSTLQETGSSGFGSTRIIAIYSGVTATIDAVTSFYISGPVIGGGSIVKVDTGTMTFNGTNSYTGSTNIAGGTIAYNTSTPVSSAPLTLSGGGSISFYAGYNFNASFASTTLGPNPGASSVSLPSFNSSSSGLSLNLGSLSNRPAGLTVDFTLPSNGIITTNSSNTSYASAGGQATILGGYATVNSGASWAVSNASGGVAGAIVPLTNFDTSFNVSGADVDVQSNVTPTISVVNSLRFNGSVSVTLNGLLTVASGGILQTPTGSFNSITGGSLTSGNGSDLIINNSDTSGFFNIYSTLVDASSGPTALTKSGAGTLILAGTNTFTGPTYVTAGKLTLQSDVALQDSTLALGTVLFASSDDNYVIGGIGTSSNISLIDTNGAAIQSLTFGGNNQNTTFSGIFTETGSSAAITLTKIGTGTTYLADGNSNFSGSVIVNGGLLEFISGASFGLAPNLVTVNNNAGVWYNGSGASVFGVNRSFALGGGNDIFEVGPLTGTANASTNSLLTIGVANNASSGILSGPGTLVKTGIGTLTLAGSNTYTGATNVSQGLLVIASNASLPVGTDLTIGATGAVQALNVSTGTYALQLNSLTNAGVLDLTRNAAVIHTGSTLAAVTSLAKQGYNSGAWNGATGITSSAAAADTAHLTAVGVIVNDVSGSALYGSGGTLASSFDGSSPVDGDILVKFTYYGDTNLDGKVDGSDYARIDAEFLQEQTSGPISGWFNGDFNYDGVINGSDYTLMDNAFNTQGAALTSEIATATSEIAGQIAGAGTSAVPEPASFGLLALGTLGLLGTRRRRQ
jgi:autotransporter-associated beta strand protein